MGGALTAFVALWGVVFAQMRAGDDPALGAQAKATPALVSSKRTATASTPTTTRSDSTTSSGSTGSARSDSTATAGGDQSAAPTASPAPVTTQQS